MRVGTQVVIGSVVAAVAGFAALVEWKAKAQALEDANNELRGRNRGLESERNSLKLNNDVLSANNRSLHEENLRLKAKEA